MSVTKTNPTDYEKICDFQHLYQAHLRARKGKRKKPEVIRFEMKLGENLARMSTELKNHQYQMQGYYHFTIYEPKERLIYAARYQDRVLLHCICDEILEPVLGVRLIYDNAACQKHKGTHFALNRFTKFLREHYKHYGNQGYVLKCDIRKYFASIDQNVLKAKLQKVIKDLDVRNLLFSYIDSYHTEGREGRGLPLGNQSSQWFAVYYMDALDRLVKEKLQIKHYIRYMDDFILLHHDKETLKRCLSEIKQFVEDELKLELNDKTQIYPLHHGIEFLGWRFFLTDTGKAIRKLKPQSKTRLKRRLKKLQKDYAEGTIELDQVRSSLASYQGHLKHGATYRLRKKVYHSFVLRRNNLNNEERVR